MLTEKQKSLLQYIYGPILCYGWRNNTLQPLSKDLQSEMLDRLKETEVKG